MYLRDYDASSSNGTQSKPTVREHYGLPNLCNDTRSLDGRRSTRTTRCCCYADSGRSRGQSEDHRQAQSLRLFQAIRPSISQGSEQVQNQVRQVDEKRFCSGSKRSPSYCKEGLILSVIDVGTYRAICPLLERVVISSLMMED